jgi:polysaccharide biosynthesis protein VpsI
MLEHCIEILGWIDKKDAHEVISNFDLFFLPSYKEGMPISILEVMSAGLPILSTSIAGFPELVINNYNGFLSHPGDIESFLKKINWMIDNYDQINKYRENSKNKIIEFSSDNFFNELIRLYDEIK